MYLSVCSLNNISRISATKKYHKRVLFGVTSWTKNVFSFVAAAIRQTLKLTKKWKKFKIRNKNKYREIFEYDIFYWVFIFYDLILEHFYLSISCSKYTFLILSNQVFVVEPMTKSKSTLSCCGVWWVKITKT